MAYSGSPSMLCRRIRANPASSGTDCINASAGSSAPEKPSASAFSLLASSAMITSASRVSNIICTRFAGMAVSTGT